MERNRNTPPRKHIAKKFIITLIFFVLICNSILHTDYIRYQLLCFGISDCYHSNNKSTVSSWDSCLKQLNCDADVVFIGDSLTAGHDFQADFPELTIANLGLNGDSILDLTDRVYMLKTVNPEKVFLMIGVNSLKNELMIEKYYNQYVNLCNSIIDAVPAVELFILSILPVSGSYDNRFLGKFRGINNRFVSNFNSMIQKYAEDNSLTYIDIHSCYDKDGALNPAYAKDSLHIVDEAYSFWVEAIQEYVKK